MLNFTSDIKNETIFITGGAGFIGSTLAGLLVANNKVIIYDNFARNSIKDKPFFNHPNLTLIQGDILDLAFLKDCISTATYIIHCAGIAGIDTVVKSPITTMQVNMVGSANLLEAASGLPNCKRVICFSTSEVFGQIAFQSNETSPAVLGAVGEARWTYAVSKLAEEHLAYAYFKERGLPTVTVRPFNVYGPGQVGEGALKAFITKALKNEDITIHGDGTQIRAWCYVDDMVEGIIHCMTSPNAVGESFNIGNSRTVTTIYGLANTVIRVLNSSSDIRFVPKTSADIELRIPSTQKSKEIIGFEAKVDLEEGILKTANFYKERL
ncbi:NAD-dependent epimerase/dehydratase family protein [Metabacillus bambusae]|uniref:NAD-dependent epimerase/dehydratase family protein n=1 Tax=Metabacillus bambusae TaxID=2795218 RepID=A0ABS3N0U4_9BACI|nr:NAD-dependent epimerase/dehydratase family protein [Metabacillus bambusae]MBO1511734.1 NAD-dependent epimerase/dehydratase family protein [Metabacillus bambusae]